MASRLFRNYQKPDPETPELEDSSEAQSKRFLPERESIVPPEPEEDPKADKAPARRNNRIKLRTNTEAVKPAEEPEPAKPIAAFRPTSSSNWKTVSRPVEPPIESDPAPTPRASRIEELPRVVEEPRFPTPVYPTPVPPPDTSDSEAYTRSLQKELLETRNLIIKNDNQIKNLGGEIKVITKLLEDERKRRAFSSASAYVLFVILSFGGLFLYFRAQLTNLEGNTKELESTKQALESKLKEQTQIDTVTKTAQTAAFELLRDLKEGRREKALKDFQTIDFEHLTPLESEILRAEVERQREAFAKQHFDRGQDLYRSKQYRKAEEEFNKALEIQKDPKLVPEILYHLGMIHYNLGNYPDAVRELEKARDESAGKAWQSEVQYYIASCYQDMKQIPRAKEEYYAYLKRWPKGLWAGYIKSKLKKLDE
jgi:tetratricopeptide (TPR) repeat protein